LTGALMHAKLALIMAVVLATLASAQTEVVRYQDQHSSVRITAARKGERKGVAAFFEGTGDLHFYAKEASAPGGYALKVEATSKDLEFGHAQFPAWTTFYDTAQEKNVEVYVGNFAVFVPMVSQRAGLDANTSTVEVKISGIACTSEICLTPFEKIIEAMVDFNHPVELEKALQLPENERVGPVAGYAAWVALLLALAAGLSLNIMPCVWPVVPLIVMRIVTQAEESRRKSMMMGLAFCIGILLFFACLAGANIVLRMVYGTVLQWGDQFRNPMFVAGTALLLVVLALFMFGLFTITVPSSISGKTQSARGYLGSVGMGFLAAILSTPCSFAILAAAFAWAQAQTLLAATLAIMTIGIGMAVPYFVLTSMPKLLEHIPKPGRWMELFKQAIGFVLLAIAVKLIAAVPEARRIGVVYFAVLLGFCVWMWGGWVTYQTRSSRKVIIRTLAVVFAVVGGWYLLSPPAQDLIDWQPYDPVKIEQARSEGTPVLIKFTADWCMSCQLVENTVYRNKEVAGLIKEKGVLAIKADTTTKDMPATKALREVYNEPGVPVTVLILPAKNAEFRWHGLAFADQLKKVLEDI
jgi:thiol:disulfide interchange protein